MTYHPPDYIDNTTADRQLREVLRCILTEWGERELDIASGFFEPEVWRMLGEALKPAGRVSVAARSPAGDRQPGRRRGLVDLRQFYRDKLRGDLEELPLNRDYAHLIDELIAFLQQRKCRGALLQRRISCTPKPISCPTLPSSAAATSRPPG